MSNDTGCNCLKEMNERLAPHNARLATGIGISNDLNEMRCVLFVATEKIDSKKRKMLPNVLATFCPFCGVKRP